MNHKAASSSTQQQQQVGYLPLTWNEARSRLRHTLERWDDERRRQQKQNCNDGDVGITDVTDNNNINNHTTSTAAARGGNFKRLLSTMSKLDDPDMIFITIPLSLLFVILSFLLLPTNNNDSDEDNNNNYSIIHHGIKMEQAASLLYLISSITSLWITKRRRKVSQDTDSSIERRRCVSSFLDGMKKCRRENNNMECDESKRYSSSKSRMDINNDNMKNVDTIPRKNVEDVYSTYRINSKHVVVGQQQSEQQQQQQGRGHWHRIPTLLLVEGDFIALKVGDIAPARCTLVRNNDDHDHTTNNIEAGERLTIDSLSSLAKDALSLDNVKTSTTTPSSVSNVSDGTASSISSVGTLPTSNTTKPESKKKNVVAGGTLHSVSSLPPGRSTLKQHSQEMLLLANGVQIFVLLETPLISFLRKDGCSSSSTKKTGALPQVLRQGRAMRLILLQLSVLVLIITLFILLVRPGGVHSISKSIIWSLPLLAALGILPVTTPVFLFWVECIGTSRILAMVHPLSSSNQQQQQQQQLTAAADQVHLENATSNNREMGKSSTWLLCRYIMATSTYRLFNKSLINKIISCWNGRRILHSYTKAAQQSSVVSTPTNTLLSIPPASFYLLEKLGVVTALALVDDELACEPFSTPQQLLIPSGQGGFTLLDICPVFDDDDDGYSTEDEDNNNNNSDENINKNNNNSDSDSDSNDETKYKHSFSAPARRLRKIKRNYKRKSRKNVISITNTPTGLVRRLQKVGESTRCSAAYDDDEIEVQFEDPQWWKHLPSLKSIGLGCMLVEQSSSSSSSIHHDHRRHYNSQEKEDDPSSSSQKVSFDTATTGDINQQASPLLSPAETSLIDHICCDQRERKQLQMLAQCIGFDTSPTLGRPRGDLSCFQERRRLHILSTSLLRQRMQLDSHALGLEESRNWSRLFTDADTVFCRDTRSGGDLLLTVGDARVVTKLCPDWWQGENSTISPLTAADRRIINDTQKGWMLSDMDVQAFSYAPLPFTADQKIAAAKDSHIYLLDNATSNAHTSSQGFWGLVKNQIFLGLLGSSVRPRKEIEPMIDNCTDAGVRFVYFSPRNMRRTKELASQMGIEMAWNCAISLRPLEEGTDDSFRMTSNYADWDINARLPHGVDDVRKHLEDVDNVPLLVSLYTDCTKTMAAQMVDVFIDYKDTVLSVGLSHLPGNQDIFSRADIAIGVDVLAEDVSFNDNHEWNALQQDEVAFVTRISAHSSVFNLWGSRSTSHLVDIIRIGRACLEAATSSVTFVVSGCLSFSIFIMLCPCTAATCVPRIPALGSFLYTQVLLPLIGLSMISTDEAKDFMTCVPPKNDASLKFSLRANKRQYLSLMLKSSLPAVIPQFLYLVALGELMWKFDSQFVENFCLQDEAVVTQKPPISSIIRCEALRYYSGPATESAALIMLASLALCTCITSASFVFRTASIYSEPPWKRNHVWMGTLVLSFIFIAIYLGSVLAEGSMTALSWYFYVLFLGTPFICLCFSEMVKKMDQKHEKRAAMMRRLQFETRLGMWSPKESTHPVGDGRNYHQRDSDSP